MRKVFTAVLSLLLMQEFARAQGEFSCTGKADGNYANPIACNSYYVCSNENAYLFSCPNNLEFSVELNRCDWPEFAKCSIEPETTVSPPVCDEPEEFRNDLIWDNDGVRFTIPLKTKLPWLDAYAECKKRNNSNLVSVNSESKYKVLLELIAKSGSLDPFWTSGTDLFEIPNANGTFTWIPSDEQVLKTFSFWGPNQPDNLGPIPGAEHCLSLTRKFNINAAHKLNDTRCVILYNFICEKPF